MRQLFWRFFTHLSSTPFSAKICCNGIKRWCVLCAGGFSAWALLGSSPFRLVAPPVWTTFRVKAQTTRLWITPLLPPPHLGLPFSLIISPVIFHELVHVSPTCHFLQYNLFLLSTYLQKPLAPLNFPVVGYSYSTIVVDTDPHVSELILFGWIRIQKS